MKPAFQKKMTDARKAAKEGRRMHAFYQGYRAFFSGAGNPFPAGGEQHPCWQNGFAYARTKQDNLPICQFGPGGDYVSGWPEAKP